MKLWDDPRTQRGTIGSETQQCPLWVRIDRILGAVHVAYTPDGDRICRQCDGSDVPQPDSCTAAQIRCPKNFQAQ